MQRSRSSERVTNYQIYGLEKCCINKVADNALTEVVEEFENSEMPDVEVDADVKDTLDKEVKMVLQLLSLFDISDVLEENEVRDISESVCDLDIAIKRKEEYRSLYQCKQRELVTLFGNAYNDKDLLLSLVKYIDDIDEIWVHLKVFGNPKMNRKFEELQKIGLVWKIKDPTSLIDALQKVINLMKDLITLSTAHKIEDELYYGDGL